VALTSSPPALCAYPSFITAETWLIMVSMIIPHPIPYQGSKRNLAATITRYFPLSFARLVEPFAGSAAISLYLATTGKSHSFVLNDINQPLIALWSEIIDHPQALASTYESLWLEQHGKEPEFYNWVRTEFNRSHQPAYLLYLLARCVKASVRYNANGDFNQSADHRRKGRSPAAMREDILLASTLLRGKTSLSHDDYHTLLAQVTPDDLIYMDPPYQGTSNSGDPRYLRSLNYESFVDTLYDLNERGIAYVVSYDGRTGTKQFGSSLPRSLNLSQLELAAGRSSQATLLGRSDITIESLYLSPALEARLSSAPHAESPIQFQLFT